MASRAVVVGVLWPDHPFQSQRNIGDPNRYLRHQPTRRRSDTRIIGYSRPERSSSIAAADWHGVCTGIEPDDAVKNNDGGNHARSTSYNLFECKKVSG